MTTTANKKLSSVPTLGIPNQEQFAQAIQDLAAGVRSLRAGPLSDKTILLLIQHSAPCKTAGARYSLSEIKDILAGIEDLARVHLKKKAG